MNKVCILDYGSGNVKSVFNLFKSISEYVTVSNDEKAIREASHIVLPGVGAFGSAMRKIHETLPMNALAKAVLEEKKPFLGICVGMQVMADYGMEFGKHEGLGWIPGSVALLGAQDLALPHIGWNEVDCQRPSSLLTGLEESRDFYFVHSYVFRPSSPSAVVATTRYGEVFCSVVQRENLIGVQFHPEKSQREGKKLVQNFLSQRSVLGT